MGDIQVKNIPDELQERLRKQARRCKTSIDAVLLTALEREALRLEWNEKLDSLEPPTLDFSPSDVLAQERAQRDAEF
ncbi:MAG: hypothetical protein OXC83_06125 [Chloroflexi bacterium]|nr:hypothetical protein [Chloroflexota bacterium]